MLNRIFILLLVFTTTANAAYNPNRPLSSGTDSVTITGTVALPTGASTSALQTSGNSILTSIAASVGGTLAASITNFPTSFQVSNFPSSQAVTGTFWQATQPVSIASSISVTGPLTDTQLRATALPVSGSFYQATQPISAAALPLPTGASTSANQATGNSSLSSIDSKLGGTLIVNGSGVTQPVSGTFWQATQPVSGTITATGPLTDTQLRATPVPVSFSGSPTVTVGNASLAVTGTFYQATQPISASALPLPTGAATESTLSTLSGKIPSLMASAPGSDTGQSAIPVRVVSQLGAGSGGGSSFTGFSGGGAISSFGGSQTVTLNNSGGGAIIVLSGTWVGALNILVGSDIVFTQYPGQVYKWDGTALGAPVSNLTANGTYYVANAGYSSLRVAPSAWTSGTVDIRIESTLATPLSRITSPFAADVKTTANIQDSAGASVTVGQKTMSASLPITVASDQPAIPVSQPDLLITGAATQTTLGNNALLASAGTTSTDVSGYRSASVQVVSTGTGGTYIFENSNDGTNFTTMTVYNSAVITGTPIVAAITATASSLIYTFPIRARYIRLRIATAITGGSIQPFTRISQESWSPAVMQIAQATAANLNVTTTGASTATLAASTNLAADVGVQYRNNATGAASRTHVVCAASTNATAVKGSAGRVLGFTAYNNNATTWRYLKFHNLATAPTVGTTAVVQTIGIPPNQYIDFNMEGGLAHSTGISISITSLAADTDTTVLSAADCGVDIIFQ